MKLKFAAVALAALFSLSTQAQTEIQWWHSMTSVNGEWVNDHGEFVLPAYWVEILVEFLVIRR